jgi:hypothetical protein
MKNKALWNVKVGGAYNNPVFVSLNCITQFAFINETQRLSCEVGTEFWNIM